MKMENAVSPRGGTSLLCLSAVSVPPHHILTPSHRKKGKSAELASGGGVPIGVSFPPNTQDWANINLACMTSGIPAFRKAGSTPLRPTIIAEKSESQRYKDTKSQSGTETTVQFHT